MEGSRDEATASAAPRAALRLDVRRVAGETVLGAMFGAAIVASAEWGGLLVGARDRFADTAQLAALLPILAGNLLPYALAVAATMTLGEVLARWLGARARFPRGLIASVAGLAAAPYAASVAKVAFSGPRAHAMAYRPALEVAFGALVVASFAALMGAALLHPRSPRARAALVAAPLGLAVAAAWLGREVLPGEYEQLHRLLAVGCLALATLAGRHVARRGVARGPTSRSVWLLVAALVASGAAVVALARADAQAWLVWRETGASRYLTRRATSLAPTRAVPADGPAMVPKPRVETAGTRADREARASAPPPDIVVFSIDGLRRDHVGAYGYTRHPTTPNLDRFAARGVVFDHAVSSYPATQVFNSSLLLGRWVGKLDGDQQPRDFRPRAVTRLLRARGYRSFVKSWFEHSSRSAFEPERFAIDTYVRKSGDKAHLEGPMEETLAPLRAHLAAADAADRPVFVWMHLLGTHPVPGGGFEADPAFAFGDTRMDRYDSAIAGSDAWLVHVEELMRARAESGRPAYWILCSDHGTNTTTASRDLYDGVTRVPLVVVGPGIEPRNEGALVDAAIDLAATIVDLAGIAPPADYDGITLAPLLLQPPSRDPAGAPSPELRARLVPLGYNKLSGAIFGDLKLLEDGRGIALFDRGADPAEVRNLIDVRADLAAQIRAAAKAELARRQRDTRKARR